jgi:hypothetical protein
MNTLCQICCCPPAAVFRLREVACDSNLCLPQRINAGDLPEGFSE